MDLGLQNKVVVVLSSAAGIGRGIATELAREGAKVVITTAEPYKKDLDAAVEFIEKETGNRPYTYISDIKDPDSLVKLIDDAARDLGGLYGLVNLCPGPKAGGFDAVNEADWADGYEKCLHSYIVAIRAALPYMKQAGGGRILQDREERPVIREIFRVHPVHQAHGVHLFEGDGRKGFQGAVERYECRLRHPR